MAESPPVPGFSGLVLEHLLGLALQPSLSGFEQGLKNLLGMFDLAAWACLFPPSFSAGGRHLFIAHHTKPDAPLLQKAAKEGWEKFIGDPSVANSRVNALAADLAPTPTTRWRVIQFSRGKQTGFTLFVYRPDQRDDFSGPELEVLAHVGRQVDRCFISLARQQEQEFFGGLLKLICDLHPEGVCVMDQRRRPILENKLFRTHMLIWEHGLEATTQVNLPKQTQLPAVWQQACEEAFSAYRQNPLSPTARLVVSHGPLVFLDQKASAVETLDGSVRYLAFQNTLGVIPYLLLTSAQRRTHTRRLPTLDRLAEQQRLSPREREVAELVLEGSSAAEMCERLKVALPTIKTHIRNLLHKTGVKTRLQFVSICHR